MERFGRMDVFSVSSSPSGDFPVPFSSLCITTSPFLFVLRFTALASGVFSTFPTISRYIVHLFIFSSAAPSILLFTLSFFLYSFSSYYLFSLPFSSLPCFHSSSHVLSTAPFPWHLPPPLYFIPTLAFPSCSLFLYIFPPFSLRWHAPDPTDSPDRGTEPEPAAVRPVQRPPGAERSQPPYSSTPAARPSTPSYTAHGCLASSSVSGSARVAGAAVPDSGRAAADPGEAAGSRGSAGCCEPAPTAADAAPNTASAANTTSHAARASRE